MFLGKVGKEIAIDERSADEMLEEAMQVAKQADVIVAVVGEAADMSGEASSMASIGLQKSQMRLCLHWSNSILL